MDVELVDLTKPKERSLGVEPTVAFCAFEYRAQYIERTRFERTAILAQGTA